MLKTYTVFCRESNNLGTTWIDTVEARDVEGAKSLGREKCAQEWGEAFCNNYDAIAVIGVAEGNVKIVFWEDLDD